MLFHENSGFANAPQRYVMLTLPVLCHAVFIRFKDNCTSIFVQIKTVCASLLDSIHRTSLKHVLQLAHIFLLRKPEVSLPRSQNPAFSFDCTSGLRDEVLGLYGVEFTNGRMTNMRVSNL